MSCDYETYHGIVLCRIIHSMPACTIGLYSKNANSCYVIDSNIGIFIKHSSKRLSPWQFTFLSEHLAQLAEMSALLKAVFLVLVCGRHGVVCLNLEETRMLLDLENAKAQAISVTRKPREKFRVRCGQSTRRTVKIAENEFPRKIFG